METAAAAVVTAIAAPVAMQMPAVHAVRKMRDAVRTETADRPGRISLILHRWTIRHFPEEMKEDARRADVNRIHENTPEPLQTVQGFFYDQINWTLLLSSICCIILHRLLQDTGKFPDCCTETDPGKQWESS